MLVSHVNEAIRQETVEIIYLVHKIMYVYVLAHCTLRTNSLDVSSYITRLMYNIGVRTTQQRVDKIKRRARRRSSERFLPGLI